MSTCNLTIEQIQELESLRQEVASLKTEKAAFEVQQQLLENLVEIERCPVRDGVLKASLQTTLDLVTALTNAEKGSLFLLDSGKVIDAILSRSEVSDRQRIQLIGRVLDKGLAGWVSTHHQVGLIADTEKDSRWLTLADQPYKVRSALAVPIHRGNELLGILTLLHSEPNRFSRELARQIEITTERLGLVLENARLYFQLKQYSAALDNELEVGRQFQIDFLPDTVYQPLNWEIAACFHPAKQVAGDFYDIFPLDNYVGLVIADVCDKGVGAALFMALMRSLIRIFSGQTQLQGFSTTGKSSQEQILQAVELTNQYVAQNHWKLSMFATMFFGVLDPATGELTYINGGHEPLFVVGDSRIKQTLKATGPAVGMMPNVKFAIGQVRLEAGDTLFGYTDGVTEGKNADGELFTSHRLRSLLEQPHTQATKLLETIATDLFTHIDRTPQFDDITMLAVRRS
ncbi:PP2C family protein-serine/threonine phosphatase [Myxosarcina sp. GI1]|uniref:PP2C family protein-serine/threonine phosphatase n=1 Tax=Myxosarcina sp. GI1 TaxID=1541065 RepID=UPI000ACBEF5F|nr:GAF domain-containing SpoIIE family protein phosphatase [Myxosarcina sp. GI1]